VVIQIEAVNDAPVADAGPDSSVTTLGFATLAGTASDDGDPFGSTLAVSWTKVSGPGLVAFGDSTAAATQAAFGAAGVYLLRVTATDGEITVSNDVTITVTPGNLPPVASAGPDRTLGAPASLTLTGTATDDGLPTGSTVHASWTKLGGPGSVTFGDPQSMQTTAAFAEPGTYLLRFTASDGQLAASDELTVTVGRPNAPPQVNAGPDRTGAYGAIVSLGGQATDDELPLGAGLNVNWSKVSGPGTVAFREFGEAAYVGQL
jgi:hypothetical protein